MKIRKKDIQSATQSKEQSQKKEEEPKLEALQIKCPYCDKTAYLIFSHGYLCDHCQKIHITVDNQKTRQMKQLYLEFKNSKYPKIFQILENMEQLDMNQPQLCLTIGSKYGQYNYHDKKEKYYRKALLGDKRDATIYNNLDVAEIMKKNYSKAIEYFYKADPLILSHSFSTPHVQRSFYANFAYALENMGRSKEAFDYLKKAKKEGYENVNKLVLDSDVGVSYSSHMVMEILKKYVNKLHNSNKNALLDSASQKNAIAYFGINNKMIPYMYIASPAFLGTNKIKKNTGIVFTNKAMYMYSNQMNIGYYFLIYNDLPFSKISFQKNILTLKCPRGGGYGTFKVDLGSEAENVFNILKEIRDLYKS